MISVCCSVFNLRKMEFEWEAALSNFIEFADELVINVNTSEDGTEDLITDWGEEMARKRPEKSLTIVFSEFSEDDPEFYGKTQNAAVQEASHQFIVLVDIDERLILSQRPQWERLALEYIQKDQCDCILIPSINLWGNELHAKNIGHKWYIQRQGVRRGVVNFARKKNGTRDTSRSDGAEPLVDKEGNLARSLALVPPQASDQEKLQIIKQNDLPYVLNYQGVDAEPEEFQVQTFEHGLKTRNENLITDAVKT